MVPWILLTAAHAQTTWNVPADFLTVQAAAVAASSGDRIEIDAGSNFERIPGTDALITKDLTLAGINGRPLLPRLNIIGAYATVENAEIRGVNRVFDDLGIDVGAFVSNGGLTLRDVDLSSSISGSAGVAGWQSEVVLESVFASGFWGAPVLYVEGGTLEVRTSQLEGNVEGTITAVDAEVSVTGTDFDSNYSYSGSDIVVDNRTGVRSLTVDDCHFTLSSGNYGGALSASNADILVTDSTFTDTFAWTGGGAIFAYGTADRPIAFEVRDSTFERAVGTDGGAILLSLIEGGLISNSDFIENTAVNGGAIALVGGDLTVVDSRLTQNWALNQGGALMVAVPEDPANDGNPFVSALSLQNTAIDGLSDTSDALVGGCIWSGPETSLSMDGGSLQQCGADFDGGGIFFSGSKLEIRNATFDRDAALRGGAVFQVDGALNIEDSLFHSNTASFGAALSTVRAEHSIHRTRFTKNQSEATGVVELLETDGLYLHGNLFCENTAQSGGIITSITTSDEGDFAIANNVWLANTSDLGSALRSVPADWLLNLGPRATVRNNDFVDNTLSAAVLLAGQADFTNNIVQGHPIGLVLEAGLNTAVTGSHNLWTDNGANAQGTNGALPSVGALIDEDPLFQGYVPRDCDSNFWLQADSPARNAGDPNLVDPDGSRSDIGAFGGPDAELVDLDGDGFWEDLDCDDGNPAVNPGVPDIPYDGVDNNCDGADLCDGDGDGHDAVSCGGTDCDDQDPEIHPKARDLPDDGVDQDCDGFASKTWISGGGGCGGCHTGGPPSAGWALGIALIGLRRRR